MPRINAYEVQVTVNGTALPEFQATVNGRVATCYIPSEVGQSFAVKWTNIIASEQRPLYLRLYFDGVLAAEQGSEQNEVIFDGKRISDTSVRSFVFTSCEDIKMLPAEDDERGNGGGIQVGNYCSADKLGEIRLDISNAIISTIKCTTCRCMSELQRESDEELVDIKPERAVDNQVPHCIGYGDEVTKERSSTLSESGCSGRHRMYEPAMVFATFIFKYRPIDVLQANNIAPRPSQPSSNGSSEPSVRLKEAYCIEDFDELVPEEEDSDILYV